MTLALSDRIWIEERARAAGFDLAGVAAVSAPESTQARDTEERFAAWIAAGYAGEMEYLKREAEGGGTVRGGLVRGDLRRAMPWARSVVMCAVNYNADAPLSVEPAAPDRGWIARYAWSGRADAGGTGATTASDYHDVLLVKLRSVEAEMRERFGATEEGFQTRCYVDTGPLLERDYAARAGIGWIGRNTCVINQGKGSWLLLGAIVTSLELAQEAWSVAASDRCGSCTRCIDACPTGALLLPAEGFVAGQTDALRQTDAVRQMDASRCISYLTIEQKGSIAENLRGQMGRQVFGCDICQDVCPWNSKGVVAATPMLPPRRELVNPELEWLAALDGPSFNRLFRGSPLERTRRRRLLRNVAIAMGNSGERRFLPRLVEWCSSEDAVLAEAARWAAARLRHPDEPATGAIGDIGEMQERAGNAGQRV